MDTQTFWTFASTLAFLIFLVWYLASDNDRTRRWTGLAAILSIVSMCFLSLYPLKEKVKLGLDLKGGTAFLIELKGNPGEGSRNQAIEVIRKRIDKFGLSEPIIQPVGSDRISVQIPGLSEADKNSARKQLSKVAKLQFKLVHPDNSRLIKKIIEDGELPPLDYEVLHIVEQIEKENREVRVALLVKRRTEMSGKYVNKAWRSFDALGRPTVVLEFTSKGSKKFGQLTTAYVNERMAIVLDNEVKSAPSINEPILGGTATISGGSMSAREAEDLASVLENPLENPVSILEERGVDPSLGIDSIRSGKRAGLIAFAAVVLFMLLYYRFAGYVSVISMSVNLLILLGLLAQFHFTLTLPGIAGIILTIGLAVDANVLIYERIRDELQGGAELRSAVRIGFDRAFSAILDGNVTTIIPAIVLMYLGSGPLKGFAVTLTLGIIANLFAALVVTRSLFEWMLLRRSFRKISMMQILNRPAINFIRWKWIALVLSIMLLAWGSFSFYTKGKDLFGVDFLGGDTLTLSYKERVPVSNIRNAFKKYEIDEGLIQYSRGVNKISISLKEKQGDKALQVLQKVYPNAGFSMSSLDRVGPQIGKELTQRALVALFLGLIGILIYAAIRFEWTFAVASAVGQVHDVIITLCIMAILGREFSLTLVGAFLAVAGYSINDKIVIFDRVRERMQFEKSSDFKEVVNKSLNKTLSRTLLTSITTIIATLSLILFGGTVIRAFSEAMLIGVIVGTFSSHYISPQLACFLHKWKEDRAKKNRQNL